MPPPPLCSNCSTPLVPGHRYCGSCGEPVAPSSDSSTVISPPGKIPFSSPSAPHSNPQGTARFLPGVLLGGRYRIIGLLGRGGMGEVYRADDIKLGQPVALKFLPAGFEAEPGRLERFLAEVRTARQASHANVCRVYDIGEAEGLHFISMEFVDGEDLASLLRRIGRLPKEKAIQIARQLCAGLAAAHEAGVLHRDLKPANVMIDGRGRARITDFGLAALAAEMDPGEIRSGTPAYMAPEQAAGRAVTPRSDIYALGLVLYELFTGKPAFSASSLDDLRRRQKETTPTSPSSFQEGFDPIVERIILRCLEADPARRPGSALAVAAALPGGDPLAAALAAGETPSPEMVAEAGGTRGASPGLAWGALLFLMAAMGILIVLAPRAQLVAMVRLDKPPEVLSDRATDLLHQAGLDREPADRLFTFEANPDYFSELRRRTTAGGAPDRAAGSLPSGILFWYRQSPVDLERKAASSLGDWMGDPPLTVPGMARVGLNPDGRLESMLIVPGERTSPENEGTEPDWVPFLRATGLDEKTLVPASPEWAPPVYADRRAAWTGVRPDQPGTPLRIEAAAAGGRVVSIQTVGPWTRPAAEPAQPDTFWSRAPGIVNALFVVVVLILACVVAVRNVRRGRGDSRGALRLALFFGATRMVWFLGAHHLLSTAEVDLFIGHLAYAMFRVGLAYVFYLAVEPYARRLWPQMLVSWVRVLEGRFRDPLVGRDLLLGCAAGGAMALVRRLVGVAATELGANTGLPAWSVWTQESLRGALSSIVAVTGIYTVELVGVIFPITMLVVLRLLLRRTGWAIAAISLLALIMFYPRSGNLAAYTVAFLGICLIAWVILFRAGLLSMAMALSVSSLLHEMPMTPTPAGWFLGSMLLALAAVLAPGLFGFWTSQAGRPLLRDEVLEPAAGR